MITTNHQQAIYSQGYVFATLTATLRPTGRVQPFSRLHIRGLPICIIHRLVKIFLVSRFPVAGSSVSKCALLNLTAELLLSNLKVANIHAILAPTPVSPHYPRIPTWSMWARTLPALLLHSIASSICFYLPVYVIRLGGTLGEQLGVSQSTQLACVLTTILLSYFGAVVPTYAIFIRVAASAQRNESMSIMGAWKSFPWSARVKFFEQLAEVLVMEAAVAIVLFVSVLAHFHPELHDAVFQFFVKYLG